MRKLLIIVDYQADFAAPDGALSAGPAALQIEPVLEQAVARTLASGGDVVFTLDTHDAATWADHPESAAFAPHCVRDTPGWRVYGALARYVGQPHVETIEKAAYCPAFEALERWVRAYDEIEIAGLVTNICVLHTAMGLYTAKVNGGLPVRLRVLREGCASFDEAAQAFALAHMAGTLGM